MNPEKSEQQHNLFSHAVSEVLQWGMNIALVIVGVILCFELFYECKILIELLRNKAEKFQLMETIVMFFLYFEFLALIVKYFKSGYHFPLRYFLYVGITAMVRLIIVDHSNPTHTLLFAGAILLMVIALFIVNSNRLKAS